MKNKVAPYAENACESGLACLLTMAQSNGWAIGMSHWLIASQTGLLAGAIVVATVFVAKVRREWVVSLLLGLVTTAADVIVHPATSLTASLAEGAVTGAGALVLSLGVRALRRSLPARRASAQER